MMIGNLKKVEVSGACPICLEDMDEPKTIVITKCSHAFHEKCMTHHLSISISEKTETSCPCCRQVPVPMVRTEELPDDLETNSYIECKMLRALRDGDLDYISATLSADPELIHKVYKNKMNNAEYNILMLATRLGHQDLVVFLLGKIKKGSIDELSSDGLSALSTACLLGHKQIAKLLIGAGAKVNHLNHNGTNALWFAASAGEIDLVELLVEFGSSVTNKSKENITALFMATQTGNKDLVKYLLQIIPKNQRKEYINTAANIENATALYMAAQAGHADIVSCLVLFGADPNQSISNGRIPLHTAALNGHLETVKILIAAGTHVNYQQSDGASALFCAALAGQKEVCKYLLSADANPALGHEEGFFRRQISAAEAARWNDHFELADYIENFRHDIQN